MISEQVLDFLTCLNKSSDRVEYPVFLRPHGQPGAQTHIWSLDTTKSYNWMNSAVCIWRAGIPISSITVGPEIEKQDTILFLFFKLCWVIETNTCSTQILVSQHCSPIKGTRAHWRNDWFRAGAEKVQGKLEISPTTRK